MSTQNRIAPEHVVIARITQKIKFLVLLYEDKNEEPRRRAMPLIMAFIAGLVLRGRILSTVTNNGDISRSTVKTAHTLLKTFVDQSYPKDKLTVEIAGVRCLIFEEVEKYYRENSIIYRETRRGFFEADALIKFVEYLAVHSGLIPTNCNTYSLSRLIWRGCTLHYTEENDVVHHLVLENIPTSSRVTVVIDDHFAAEKAVYTTPDVISDNSCVYRLDAVDRDLRMKYPRPGIAHSVSIVMEPVNGIFDLDKPQPMFDAKICKIPVFTNDVSLSRKLQLSRYVCQKTPAIDWYVHLETYEYESSATQDGTDNYMIISDTPCCPYTLETPIVDAVVSTRCKGVHPFSLRNFQASVNRTGTLTQPWRCPVCTAPFLPNHLRKYTQVHQRKRL